MLAKRFYTVFSSQQAILIQRYLTTLLYTGGRFFLHMIWNSTWFYSFGVYPQFLVVGAIDWMVFGLMEIGIVKFAKDIRS